MKTLARMAPGVGAVYGAIQAFNSAKHGDYIGATLGLVSMIPGPIGWVGVAGSMVRDAHPPAISSGDGPQPGDAYRGQNVS